MSIEVGFPPDEGDMVFLGSGLPSSSLGWINNIYSNHFDISFKFRGDFGHKIANLARQRYEIGDQFSDFNVIKSNLYEDFNHVQGFSSYYVEDGSYLLFESLSINYKLKKLNLKHVDQLSLALTLNNLFYVSSYTGLDPNARLTDSGGTLNGSRSNIEFNPSVMSPGIDRINRYPLERIISLSIRLIL